MKLGVYVGSFNPVHKGHIKIGNYLLNNHLNKVLMMPTGAYWDKNDLPDIKDRINMLRLYENEKIIIEDEKNDLPYTYLVMEHLGKKYKNDELYLIIGADNIVNFDKWEKYKDLLKYNMVIISRENIDVKYYLDRLGKKDKYTVIDNLEDMDISSTMVRNLIKANKIEDTNKLIDKPVLEYIKKNNLYKS